MTGPLHIINLTASAKAGALIINMEPGPSEPVLLRGDAIASTLRPACDAGRARVRFTPDDQSTGPLAWDDDTPWLLQLNVAESASGYAVTAALERHGVEMPLSEPRLLLEDGYLIRTATIARLDHAGAFAFIRRFLEQPVIEFAREDLIAFLDRLFAMARRPPVVLPPSVGITEVREPPRPSLSILPDPATWRVARSRLEVDFRYGPVRIAAGAPSDTIFDAAARVLHHRDRAAEDRALARLESFGARQDDDAAADDERFLTTPTARISDIVVALLAEGWEIDAEGAEFRAATGTRASVRSGIDWFELDAGVRFGEIEVSLAELIAARRAGRTTVALPDGSQGILPSAWLARLAPLVAGADATTGTTRYARSQVALLDALLATIPEVDVDAKFESARHQLRAFDRIAPADPPPTFQGTLRAYQREGLGWLHFLRTFGLGGCLADDMGLGKTVQVLALLESRRVSADREGRPSIVVVPRSLVFNWMREAARFTPDLRVLDYSGPGRKPSSIDGADVDLVITTYGTLRRDAVELAGIEFDYAILDEAQAIKNPASASAKASRLIRARHRLAMTGTPIENRLEELWSLFEFLNPGMLGTSTTFASLVRLGADDVEPGGRDLLARALRPVILRRLKEQVATDLPPRVEQTLFVDLEEPQRKFYDGLLEAYRRSVLEEVDREGVGRARMHILEALLRLRQAACHPVLADPRQVDAPSAKIDALLPAIEEVVAEGHKVLVFSQFTSFLALVRARLDEQGTPYEYLDGSTTNRQERVDRFQEDPDCRVFLISLKAGGHGLNLTAADYVYILDPWWNPAVEAQAIDRAHRIGQTRHVIATRIVALGTIEEKILELQASKRALADAILGQDQGVLAGIGRAELEMLFG